MRSDIIWKNARHSARDYLIYQLTMLLALSLIYAFNLLVFSEEILALAVDMNALTFVVVGLSFIVVWVIGWLVHYMSRFMLEKRSREFGTYLLLGVPNKTVASVFVRENIMMGAVAFAASLVTGAILFKLLALIVVRLFGADGSVSAGFSWQGFLLTVIYTVIIYGRAMLKMKKYIKRVEIGDLLYADQRSESTSREKGKKGLMRFFLWLAVLAAGGAVNFSVCAGWLSGSAGGYLYLASFGVILAGVYGVYTTFTCFLTSTLLAGAAFKYERDRLFLLRGIASKLGSIGKTLGTLAVLLTLTLTATQLGVLFDWFISAQMRGVSGVEILASYEGEEPDLRKLTQYVQGEYGIAFERRYPLYYLEETELYDYCGLWGYMEGTPVLAWSDFKAVWDALGYGPAELEEGRYLLLSADKVRKKLQESPAPALTIGGQTLALQECRTEAFNVDGGGHGTGYTVVVEDSLAQTLPLWQTCVAIQTQKPVKATDAENLFSLVFNNDDRRMSSFRTNAQAKSLKSAAVVSYAFSLFYVGLIFACIAATILAVQQLSDAVRYQYRYEVLSKLGMSGRRIERLVLKQTALYFFLPVCLPVAASIFFSYGFNRFILINLVTGGAYLLAVLLSVGLFLFVYLLYFLATYLGYKRKIMENIE